jgi:hypothetical protein
VAAQRYVAFLGTAVAAKRYAVAAAGVGLAARALALKSAMDAPNDAPKSIDPWDVGGWQGKRFCVWMGVGASFLPANVCPANEPPLVPRNFGPGALTLGKATPMLKPPLLDDPNVLSFLEGINSARGNTPRNDANCAPCAASVDAALDGRPAGPAIPLNDGTPICQIESFYGRVFGPPTTIETIDMALKNLGPGARAIIVGYRADGSSHAFNVVNRRDIVQFPDGQIEGFAELGKRQGYRGFRARRTGNRCRAGSGQHALVSIRIRCVRRVILALPDGFGALARAHPRHHGTVAVARAHLLAHSRIDLSVHIVA